MTTRDVIDILERELEGAITTSENKYDFDHMLSLLDLGRAVWLVDSYAKDKRLAPTCYQKYYPQLSIPLQPTDNCFKKFQMPDIIRLDEHSDGIRYVGSDDYNSPDTNNFSRIVSRAWLSTYKKHPVMNPNRFFSFLYDADAQILELYGKANLTEAPLVEALFKHPTQLPTFNIDTDDYPLPLDGIKAVEMMITQSDTRLMEATTPRPAFAAQAMIPKN